ncbi:MAG: hypothetical protein ACUZ8E_01710 [Candidatus Anammoxibacter sp.]
MKLAVITGGSKALGNSLVESLFDFGWEVKEFSRSGKEDCHESMDFQDLTGSIAKAKATGVVSLKQQGSYLNN